MLALLSPLPITQQQLPATSFYAPPKQKRKIRDSRGLGGNLLEAES